MTESEILDWFEANRDERGVAHWEKGYAADSGLQSFGVGLTRLRKLAKKVGRDHELSQRLWTSPWYDVRVLALLVDDPKAITRAQAEEQVDQVQVGQLAHVFSSCDATLARAPFVRELAEEWMASGDSIRERCGYGLLYELSKS
ncbi:MAG: hypothetical protein GY913_27445, partial [Proteobacteria bacterium]|nr:hypothetical protein [Pseudomonadota bacterium]